jgi:hypothetical protein
LICFCAGIYFCYARAGHSSRRSENALLKDGRIITDGPYVIEYKELTLFADLAAERVIAAERSGRKIVVEVKSFVGISKLQDLKVALGQYDIYNIFLSLTEPGRKLYIAISEKVYDDFFGQEAIQVVVETLQLPLIIVKLETEEIVKWIS